MVVALHLTLEDAPLAVAGLDYWQLLQLVHHLVHRFLHRLGQVAVGLFALDCLQLSGQLLHQRFCFRVSADAPGHLLGEPPDGPPRLPHQLIPGLGLLLVGVEHLLSENLVGEHGLDPADAVPREICLPRLR